ncbi:hypothetical protein OCU04_010053 [Sclerotinia nivalis]|uniref:RING-CH-type domain-containing protein n=1 Tax=Sclerotinia nivalis TaxID=352851 RepID=A0A9X0AHC6_9HELO|nr:hypothetical protein OCU04_010053 [Sclerotinia nivalis]
MESAYPALPKVRDRIDPVRPEQSNQESLAAPPSSDSSLETTLPKVEESNEAHVLNQPQSDNSTQSDDAQQDIISPPQGEMKTCWICQMDDTDDGPQTSPWRSPCPCSLQAHESCLMEWIAVSADKEMAPKIACPVCKYQLKIDQPKDYLVLTADKLQRMAKHLVLPTAAGAVFSCVYSGSLLFGVNSLALIFGADEARTITLEHYDDFLDRRILGDYIQLPIGQIMTKYLFPFLGGSFMTVPSWRTAIGLPLIAPTLILSRTKIADSVFTIVPVTYFLFSPDNKNITSWPPSPGRTFALLPYVRLAYNTLYHHMFYDLEKRWDLAVQRKPREGETAEQIALEQRRGQEGFLNFEVEIVDEVRDQDGNLVPPDDHVHAPAGDRNGNRHQNGGDQEGENANENDWGVRRNVSTHSLSFQFMGAMLFPAISSIMGDALKYALPSIWMRTRNGKPGLLQHKWARSVVGGCLFVMLKDVVVLYCKWKKARDFGKKKIIDFAGKGKEKAA